jgi:hypothetical protein
MDFGQVTAGLSVRDLGGTRYLMKGYTLTQVLGAATFTTGTGSDPNTVYTSPTSVSLGVDWQPDLGSLGILVQPRVVADWTMPMATLETLPSFWSCLHLGAEVKLLSYLALRAGLNQGWLTAGLGAHLAFVDLNIAVYSDELGRFSGANRRPAISAELAFRL